MDLLKQQVVEEPLCVVLRMIVGEPDKLGRVALVDVRLLELAIPQAQFRRRRLVLGDAVGLLDQWNAEID